MTPDEELLSAPNQQVVRPDGSHPSEEGSGGSEHGKSKDKSADTEKDTETTPSKSAYKRRPSK